MRRLHLIEIHEQPWVPTFLRDAVTDSLEFGFNRLRAYACIAPLLQSALRSTSQSSIVDLCSGAGGPWKDLAKRLQASGGKAEAKAKSNELKITLTDKYPNSRPDQRSPALGENPVLFYKDSVDATNVPPQLTGFRTMFTSFHHFKPDQARAILRNAVEAGEGIAIFEIPRRACSTMALTCGFVFLLFLGAPWVRPFRWSRFSWTYLVPITPIVLLFDGLVSCLRAYRPDELLALTHSLPTCSYTWESGECSGKSKRVIVTYLIGIPAPTEADEVFAGKTSQTPVIAVTAETIAPAV